ncbi:MAG TPA: signal peptide peptidase SppA [Dehalococcoidia bacterium]|jgi:protease-4|nr:signal peptide peptidase SppA [Dehalococcoidia bacterium]
MELRFLGRPRVAVAELHGAIGGPLKSRTLAPLLKALREDKQIKALVLDIDSPGGSASESDYLYEAIRAVGARKPVVAYIRSVGASGGYFLACAAERIVAQRSAIVGSIGVITIRPQIVELMQKVGVEVDVLATGPYKGMGLPFKKETPEERQKNEALINAFFDRFVDVVAAGRRVPRERALAWATGEVFWASQARDQGLVDELGTLERAIAVAAGLGRVPEKNAVTVKPKLPLGQRLLQQITSPAGAALRAELDRLLAPRIEYR